MTKKQIISKTAKFVKSRLNKESTGHDWWHTYRVWNTALKIGKEENADLFVVQLAALLHDIADWKFNKGTVDAGVLITRKWLRKIQVEVNAIEHVEDIVANISFKGAGVKNKINTKEGLIVQDADRLDAIGAIGIARTFAYGGFAKREIYNPQIKTKIHKTFGQYKKSKSTSINHFYEKLIFIKDRMNTKTGKKLAIERHSFIEKYLKQFFKEWNIK